MLKMDGNWKLDFLVSDSENGRSFESERTCETVKSNKLHFHILKKDGLLKVDGLLKLSS